MRRAALAGLPARSRGKRTRKIATVTDLVRRDFRRTGSDQLWVTDITEHPAREGKVYCCVVSGAWSRRVAGPAIDSAQRADLATSALGMAIDYRRPAAGGIIHADRGAVHLLDLHRAGLQGRAAALAGQRRGSVRQRRRRVVLGPHAN
jgi:putative transposase